MKVKSDPKHFIIALGVGILIVAAGMLTWLYWPDPPQQESASLKRITRVQYDRDVMPAFPEPVASAKRPFTCKVEEVTFHNISEDPLKLKANARLLIRAYVEPEADVQGISAMVPDYSLNVVMADDGESDDRKPGDGIWGGHIDTQELPVGVDIPLNLEFDGIKPSSLKCDQVIRVDVPFVFPIELSRKPVGPVKPGTPIKFMLKTNQSTSLGNFEIKMDQDQQVVAKHGYDFYLCNRMSPSQEEFEIEWRWDESSIPEPGFHELVAYVKPTIGQNTNFVLPLEPIELDYTQVSFTNVKFDPAPPVKYGSQVKVTAYTDKPITEGAVAAHIMHCGTAILHGDGCALKGVITCDWRESAWAHPTLTCSLVHKVNNLELASYETELPFEPMPQVKIVEFTYTPDRPVMRGEEVSFRAVLDPPVTFGTMKVVMDTTLGHTLCQMHDYNGGDSVKGDGVWHGTMTWPEFYPSGKWGPLHVVYAIRGLQWSDLAYKTEYIGTELVVLEDDENATVE